MPRNANKTTTKKPKTAGSRAEGYTILTFPQRARIVRYAMSCPWLSPQSVALWAQRYFDLDKAPGRSTIRRWLAIARGLKPATSANRLQTPWKELRELEPELAKWVLGQEANDLGGVGSHLLKEHARHELIERGVPLDKLPKLSNGWLHRFQKRYDVWLRTLCGESGSVSKTMVDQGRKAMKDVTQGFQPRDIYNMDETAFFYREKPRKGYSQKSKKGSKQRKERLTVAVTTNADGSDRLPLLVVGTAGRPHSFKQDANENVHLVYGPHNEDGSPQWGTNGERASALYAQTAKGWMTRPLFSAWLSWLNNRMKRRDRKILLVVDNVSSHRVGSTSLSHVKLAFLPKNTTSVLQPMDQGVIRSLKARTTRKRASLAYSRWRGQKGDPYMITSWDAFVLVMGAWSEVEKKTIVKCWAKADILSSSSIRCSIENLLR